MMETAKDVCGMSKGPCRHKETWWYSQTSLYRTRLIRTSGYIEFRLWSWPQAIIKGRENDGFIEHRYNEVSAISSMQHHPHVSMTVVYIEHVRGHGRQLQGRLVKCDTCQQYTYQLVKLPCCNS